MKRWRGDVGGFVKNKKIDCFLEEIIAVCKKHNMSISHEDTHGSFVIEEYNYSCEKWLLEADDATGGGNDEN